jgi:hypothetical protein
MNWIERPGLTIGIEPLSREWTNNAMAFKFLNHDESVPVGSTWIPCHMIFDVKMDLTRKARFLA